MLYFNKKLTEFFFQRIGMYFATNFLNINN